MVNEMIVRSLHDLGLAGWYGRSLQAATGPGGARTQGSSEREQGAERTGEEGATWPPGAIVSITAHLIGGAGLILANRKRHKQQPAVMATTITKAMITGAALSATMYAGILGRQTRRLEGELGEQPTLDQQEQVARIQSRLTAVGWSVPVLTAMLVVLGAREGELQRGPQGVRGTVLEALTPGATLSRLGSGLAEAATQLRESVSERVPGFDSAA